jgi:hypothetical protein
MFFGQLVPGIYPHIDLEYLFSVDFVGLWNKLSFTVRALHA